MSSDDFRCCSVQGLTVGLPRVGYLCFCKTKGGNPKFYDWLIKNPVAEFISEMKLFEAFDYQVLYSTDGENIQLQAFQRNEGV